MKYLLFLFAFGYTTFSYSQNQPAPASDNAVPSLVSPEPTPIPANTIYTVVEQMPEFPGGDDAMMKFIQRNIKYPDMERESDIQGRVVIGMVVNQDGSLSDIVVKKGVSSGIDKEALRVVRLMPQFKPGKQSGKPVRVRYLIPIMFKLASPEPPKTKQ